MLPVVTCARTAGAIATIASREMHNRKRNLGIAPPSCESSENRLRTTESFCHLYWECGVECMRSFDQNQHTRNERATSWRLFKNLNRIFKKRSIKNSSGKPRSTGTSAA